MTPLSQLAVFFGLVLGIVVLPGLDMAFVLASALSGGRPVGLSAVAGIVAGAAGHVTMAALGVAVVLRLYPAAFDGLLLAGGLYVGWLGVSLLRSEAFLAPSTGSSAVSRSSAFRRGALTNLLNPKAYVFMLAVFPQFVRPEWGPLARQAVVLWAIIAAVQLAVYGAVALGAARVRGWLEASPQAQRAMARSIGLLLAGAALATVLESWRLR